MMKVYIVLMHIKSTDIDKYPFFQYSDLPFKDDKDPIIKIMNSHAIGLYGFTTNKEILNEFRCERDMQLFYTKHLKMCSDEYERFSDRYGDYELKRHTYSSVNITSSSFEYHHILDSITNTIYGKLSDIGYIPISKFTPNVKDALYRLGADIILDTTDDSEFGIYEDNLWHYDEFTLFLEEFGNTFKLRKG